MTDTFDTDLRKTNQIRYKEETANELDRSLLELDPNYLTYLIWGTGLFTTMFQLSGAVHTREHFKLDGGQDMVMDIDGIDIVYR